jgi:hypothetical protein
MQGSTTTYRHMLQGSTASSTAAPLFPGQQLQPLQPTCFLLAAQHLPPCAAYISNPHNPSTPSFYIQPAAAIAAALLHPQAKPSHTPMVATLLLLSWTSHQLLPLAAAP